MNPKAYLPIIMLAFTSPTLLADTSNPNASNHLASNAQNEHGNAIEIILQDHDQIRKMIAKLDKNLNSNISESRSDFKELKNFLVNHETMEEKTWYPELEKHKDLKDIVTKLKNEEQAASDELKNLDNITDDKQWVSKVKKLIKDVKHHAQDEESKLFPKVKKDLDKSSLEEIGDKMRDYKKSNEN